ncbi:DUF4760 domain-containing protein [Pectobacterium punjabense]|nr:DUF4760 domain-containing protein [Pectobacterium punjabense]
MQDISPAFFWNIEMDLIFLTTQSLPQNVSFIDWLLKNLPAATPIIALSATVIAYFGYRRQRRLHQEKLSYDFESFYQNDKELKEHRENLNTLFKKHRREKLDLKVFANLDSENDYGKSIMFVLNNWEKCAHAIKEELLDEDYLYNVFHIVALRAYTLLEGYIDARRKLPGNSDAYLNYRWLAERWKLKRLIEEEKNDTKDLEDLVMKASTLCFKTKKNKENGVKYKTKDLKKAYNELTLINKKKGFIQWIRYLLLQKF